MNYLGAVSISTLNRTVSLFNVQDPLSLVKCAGEIVNASRKRNEYAEGQPAVWVNVGMEVDGQNGWANVAVFDHPGNRGYPNKLQD